MEPALAREDRIDCAAALCFRSRLGTTEFSPSPPGMAAVGVTNTERANVDEIRWLNFHFPGVTAELTLLPRIRDVSPLLWIRPPSSWARPVPQRRPVSSRMSVRFLRISFPPSSVAYVFAKLPAAR